MTLCFGQQHPITVYRTVFWGALFWSWVSQCAPFTISLIEFYFIMIFIMILVTIIGIFMTILYFLNYTFMYKGMCCYKHCLNETDVGLLNLHYHREHYEWQNYWYHGSHTKQNIILHITMLDLFSNQSSMPLTRMIITTLMWYIFIKYKNVNNLCIKYIPLLYHTCL